MASMQNRVPTTPCFCSSSVGRGGKTTVWRTGVCRGRNAVVDFSLSRPIIYIYIYNFTALRNVISRTHVNTYILI